MPPTWKTVWLWLSEQTHIPITWQFQFLTWPSLWCTPRTWPRTRTAEFFPPATHWNQPKCPSRRGWIKMQAVHSIQPCRAGQISVQAPQGDHVHTLHRQHGLTCPSVPDAQGHWLSNCVERSLQPTWGWPDLTRSWPQSLGRSKPVHWDGTFFP